jgi:hypothetical protein
MAALLRRLVLVLLALASGATSAYAAEANVRVVDVGAGLCVVA